MHDLTLKGKALGERSPQLFCVVFVILVVAVRLEPRGGMEDMVHVIVPLRCVMLRITGLISSEPSRLIGFVFENEMNRVRSGRSTNPLC